LFSSYEEKISSNSPSHTVIIDGKTMCYYDTLKEDEKKAFLILLSTASSAICCRLTPKQKANIVRLIKNIQGKVALSIGDGTNDVPMIMEANIGIGISGKEGTQVKFI
jgi:phospholipid-translocating ATPase